MNRIEISLSEAGQDRISEVRVDGVIDTITAGELEEVIDALIDRNRYRIVVDLAGVEYISSPGWGIFISHIKGVRANDGDIKLANMVPNVKEIFELLELDNVLKAYASVDEARGDFLARAKRSEEKKKAGRLTRLTFDDIIAGGQSPDPRQASSGRILKGGQPRDTVAAVLECIQQDPFASIAEIKKQVNSGNNGASVGWWRVFRILRRHRLLRKRSRFQLARRR